MNGSSYMELLPGWSRSTLKSLGVEAQPGFASGRHNRSGHGVLHLRPMNITRIGTLDLTNNRYIDDESGRRVQPGDVLFNNTNSPALVGKTAVVTLRQPAAYSNHMTRLRPLVGLLPEYLAVYMHWLWMRGYFQTILKNHVNQASVATGKLLETVITVPPEEEQLRILDSLGGYVSRLDVALQSLARAQALIPSQRRGLHTTATEGRLAATHPGMIPDFPSVRREIWTASKPGERYKEPAPPNAGGFPAAPPSWRIFSLEEVTDPIRIIRYGILMPKVKTGGSVPYVEVKDLKGCSLHGKGLRLTSTELDEQFAGARIRPGDVLLAVRGSYDRSAVVPANLESANVSRDVARIAPLPGIDPEYLHLYLQSDFAQRYLQAQARGVAVKGVNIAAIRSLPVALPTMATQRSIVEKVQQQTTAIDTAEKAVWQSHHRGTALRRALLDRAFSGPLTTGVRL